ncbi:hypothetical protein BU23DRAFT_564174 [Bimuria novae-zelandiae CBS 107.79]|uniref:Heterokaryon incompatibility domain-containing protein n=1 Tax=Bimuria novae-zelandiae CBS 107.79 TaxID=1447943 RepID=A0A6A5VPX5_9PLEO|nr:hypothetical protein BU23DRAFT_564174 [Bimuria novae-zelandiae CBS 107.79]
MGDIYSGAEQVIFWLGHVRSLQTIPTEKLWSQPQQQSQLLRPYIQLDPGDEARLARYRELWSEKQPNQDWHDDHTRGLLELMRRSWFDRVWILQEVANAKNTIVCAGAKAVSPQIFTLAPSIMGVDPGQHRQAVLETMLGPSRNSSECWWRHNRNLYTILHKFSTSQASDSRDRVYALLGISSDAADTDELRPEYTQSVEQVLDNATSFIFGILSCPFERMDDFLMLIRRTPWKAFIKILETGNEDEVFAFRQKLRGVYHFDDRYAFEAAASNRHHGAAVMLVLLNDLRTPIPTSVATLTLAIIRNTECEPAIFELVYVRADTKQRKRMAALMVTAALLDIGCGKLFLNRLERQYDLEDFGALLATVVPRGSWKGNDLIEIVRRASSYKRSGTYTRVFDLMSEHYGLPID